MRSHVEQLTVFSIKQIARLWGCDSIPLPRFAYPGCLGVFLGWCPLAV